MLLLDYMLRGFRVPRRIFQKLDRLVLKSRFKSVGENFITPCGSAAFLSPHTTQIGTDVFVGEDAHFTGEITIGNNVLFGPRVMIITGNHYFAVRTRSVRFLHPRNAENVEPVTVEDEVWCGAGAIILGGVTIGMGAVIGAGSVLTKSIPPYVVAVGNYCRPVRRIFSDEALAGHLKALGYDSAASQTILRQGAGSPWLA